jgi:hypothetical protein
MTLLGRYLIEGRYLPETPREGTMWLTRAAGICGVEPARLGPAIYHRALQGATPSMRRRLIQEAAAQLLVGHSQNDLDSSLLLGYVVRRGEVEAAVYPALDELFRRGLAAEIPFAVVNEALRRAAGVQCAADWRSADHLLTSLPGTSGVIEWWLQRLRQGDAEGTLVVAWLARHGLSPDPDGQTPGDRFRLASPPWEVPEWMQ